jgi:thioredoxin-dependent peroxiredoxin
LCNQFGVVKKETRQMPLRAGDPAPLFTARDLLGRTISLRDCYGYPVMVALYRSAACPLCNLRLWYLLRRHSRLYNYVLRLIVLFDSEPQHAHYYLDRFATQVPLIADRGQGVYDLYQPQSSLPSALITRLRRRHLYEEARYASVGAKSFVENIRAFDGDLGLLPAEFLLTPDLQIARAHYGKDTGDFLPFSEIDTFVLQYIRSS